MTAGGFTEFVVEDAALAWLEALGYIVLDAPAKEQLVVETAS